MANRPTRFVPLLLVVLALVAAACGSSSDSVDAVPDVSIEIAPVTVNGDALPPLGSMANDDGLIAPGFTAQSTHSSEPVTLDVADGTVRLVGFFAHWCPHCQNEVPRVSAYIESNGTPDGVEFAAVSTSVDAGSPNYPPSEWFDREDFPITVFVDSAEGELAQAYGLTGFPFWVVVGGDGSIIQRVSGELTESQLDTLVQLAASQAG